MGDTDDQNKLNFDRDKLDYEQTTTYFRSLHETRFRLLQFLPLITGISIYTTANHGNEFRMLLGLLGIFVVIGLTIYDQRNNMIYDRLTKRASFLEKKMGFSALPTDSIFGGAFWSRPSRGKVFGMRIIWHDLALAIIYSASFGVWIYMLFDGASVKWCWGQFWKYAPTILCTVIYFIIYISLVKRNDRDNEVIHKLLEGQ